MYFLILSILASSPDATSSSVASWNNVAKTAVIIIGELSIPKESVDALANSHYKGFIKLQVKVDRCLKGSVREGSAVVNYSTFLKDDWLPPEQLMGMNNKSAILFLCRSDRLGDSAFYFPYVKPACAAYTDELAASIAREVQEQKKIMDDTRKMSAKDFPHYREVKRYVRGLARRDSEQESLDGLIKLGTSAVPAMVFLMDDFRPVAGEMLHVENRAVHAFERYAQYTPQVIADVIDLALGQIVGDGYGHLESGATNEERKRVIDAWRVYLHHSGLLDRSSQTGRTESLHDTNSELH